LRWFGKGSPEFELWARGLQYREGVIITH